MTAATAERLAPAELFERNRAWAEGIARNVARKLPTSFEADDLKQAALIEMWKRAELYDPRNTRGTPFQAYAYLAVRGACLMLARRKNWREAQHADIDARHDDGGLRVEPVSPAPTPQQKSLDREAQHNVIGPRAYRKRKWLLGQIAKLSPVDAHLIRRTYLEEADLDTLAELQGTDKATLARRLAGIVKRLIKARQTKAAPKIAQMVKMAKMAKREKRPMEATINYATVVAELEARRARIDVNITALDKLRASRADISTAITALKKVMAGEARSTKPPAAKTQPARAS